MTQPAVSRTRTPSGQSCQRRPPTARPPRVTRWLLHAGPRPVSRAQIAQHHLRAVRLPLGQRRLRPETGAEDGGQRVHVRHVERSEEHTSELQSRQYLVCRLLLEKKKKQHTRE